MIRALFLALSVLVAGPAAAGQYARETSRLVDATAELFDALEATSASSDRPAIRLRLDLEEKASFTDAGEALRPELGPVRDLTAYRTTWYETGGLIGTVDFVGTWGDGRHLLCGYVSWDMSDPDAPTLDDIVADYLEIGALAGSGADEAHVALIEANCAYGEIEPNFDLVSRR